MAYKFLDASLPISFDPKTTFINDFQNLLYEEFRNASTFTTIQEETSFGTGTLADIDVRVTTAIDSLTGDKHGDDFKLILFEDIDHATGIGYMYYFDDNWWVTVNSEIIKNLAATATVRRCNNVLRWRADDGGVYSVPCAIDNSIKMNRNLSPSGSAVVMPSGYIAVFAQFNTKSNKIKPNQRFLFGNPGNWIAYRIVGGGLQNFNNLKTADNTSVGLMEMDMSTDELNLTNDDLTNGIANSNQFQYSIALNNVSLSGVVDDTFQLVPTVKMNGQVVTALVTWTSSDPLIATVSSSGVVTFVAAGTCNVTSALTTNSGVYVTGHVTVSELPVDNYNVVVTPESDYILETDSQTYGIHLYLNGVLQADVFIFSLANANVPASHYTLSVLNGNSFSVKNNSMYLNYPLLINCVSGIYSKQVSIILRGAW